MATRALIGYDATPMGQTTKVLARYLHYDGYPEHVLPILKERYNSLESVVPLVHCGADIRSLAGRVTDCDFFDDEKPDPCVFDSVEDFIRPRDNLVDYRYLLRDGAWEVF